MMEKIKFLWKSWDRNILVNQRQLILGVAACTLAALAAGLLLSPKRSTVIGSYNTGSGAAAGDCGDVPPPDCEDPLGV